MKRRTLQPLKPPRQLEEEEEEEEEGEEKLLKSCQHPQLRVLSVIDVDFLARRALYPPKNIRGKWREAVYIQKYHICQT
jgi:hypothetical protein